MPNRIHGCVLPSSGEWLATHAAGAVWVWDVESGDLRGMFDGGLVAAAPDGAWLAIGEPRTTAGRRRIRLYRMPDGRLSGELDVGPDDKPVATAPDGTWLALGHPAQPLALYGMPDGRLLDTTAPAARTVTADDAFDVDGNERFVSAPDASWLAAEIGPRQSRTRVWDTATGEVRAAFACPLGPVHAVSPDGSWVAATPEETRTTLLDTTGGRSTPVPLGEHNSPVTSYAFSPDSARLAVGCQDGTLWLWDLDAPGAAERADPRRVPLSSCAAAPDGSWLATTDDNGPDGWITIWDAVTGDRRHAFGSGRYSSCVVAPDGAWLAAADRDAVVIWEVTTGRLLHRIECPVRPGESLLSAATNHVFDLAAAPDGAWLAAACEDGTVRLLDVATGQERDLLEHPAVTGRMLRCVVAPDASRLVYSGLGGTVVHDLPSGTSRKVDSSSRLLCISPCGSLLASAHGPDIRVWAAATGETLHVLRGHTHPVKTCEWSPDGTRLASVGDHTVRVWAADTGENETTVRLYADPDDSRNPMDCRWLPDGRSLAVAGKQGLCLFETDPVRVGDGNGLGNSAPAAARSGPYAGGQDVASPVAVRLSGWS
ncbi:WD40 repeat domain-containing protein [Streptomyces sp. NPDC049879]|uniref:WD40 repeat domain-containing protein n=1 Tax=Streptomyces sp. NPDC049879 TaxID=3365598 RepID=UPI0037AC3B79